MSARCATFAVHAACLRGVEAFGVTVEVSASGTIPSLTIVGMADAAVMEARSRIRCALRSSGFDVPRCALTVSLAPGDIRKTGSGLDLPTSAVPPMGMCLFRERTHGASTTSRALRMESSRRGGPIARPRPAQRRS